jgi:hypothetical protein
MKEERIYTMYCVNSEIKYIHNKDKEGLTADTVLLCTKKPAPNS